MADMPKNVEFQSKNFFVYLKVFLNIHYIFLYHNTVGRYKHFRLKLL